MSTINLDVFRGYDATLRFTLTDLPASGLSGCTVKLQVKKSLLDAADYLTKTTAIGAQGSIVTVGSDTVDGVVDFFLVPADTSGLSAYTVAMPHNVVVTDNSGKDYLVADGYLTVRADTDVGS